MYVMLTQKLSKGFVSYLFVAFLSWFLIGSIETYYLKKDQLKARTRAPKLTLARFSKIN